MNPILLTDSYKVSHWKQYPPKTTGVFSYFESRGGEYKEPIFFGLQYLIKRFFMRQVNSSNIVEAEDFFNDHFGRPDLFNKEGWQGIIDRHRGWLPLRIKAVKEGTRVPFHNALLTVENTDPECWWLTNYMETILSQVWYPMTVMTLSNDCKRTIFRNLVDNGTPEEIDFKLHDFGYRGSTSDESAGIGGCAHLVNFKGTDTLAALRVARAYYGEKMAGFSIPAAEHSTITSWGRDHEVDAFRNMLTSYPTGLVAVVSDSYDINAACDHLWGEILHDDVLNRDGRLVIRPDSGYPPDVVLKCVETLAQRFGFERNQKGYRVLNPKVRIIQGDGVSPEMISLVLAKLSMNGWSADNVAFGMGGKLLQDVNRDTCKCAFKCSAIEVDGAWRDVFKEPATDLSKRSKPGRLALIHEEGKWSTLRETEVGPHSNLLEVVYENGKIVRNQTLGEIRDLASH